MARSGCWPSIDWKFKEIIYFNLYFGNTNDLLNTVDDDLLAECERLERFGTGHSPAAEYPFARLLVAVIVGDPPLKLHGRMLIR